MAISAIFLKWSGFPSRRSTSIAASVKVMYVLVEKGVGAVIFVPAPPLSTLKHPDSAMILDPQ